MGFKIKNFYQKTSPLRQQKTSPLRQTEDHSGATEVKKTYHDGSWGTDGELRGTLWSDGTFVKSAYTLKLEDADGMTAEPVNEAMTPYMTDEEAKQALLANVEGELLNEPRVIKYKTGTRRKHWNKNCIAVGLSAGFIEPLESTGIHLFQRAIIRLIQMFPSNGISQTDVDEFNQQTKVQTDAIKDFIILHYHLTDRKDTPFWRYCRNMDIPESLAHRMKMFKESGKIFRDPDDLFGDTSWIQVMMGQGLMPEQYHPIVDLMSDIELQNFLDKIKTGVKRKVDSWPDHNDFINHYCQSNQA